MLRTIDLFVAAGMRSSEDLDRRLHEAGIAREDLVEARRLTDLAGFRNPLDVRRETILRCFGPAESSSDDALEYRLELWPNHRFTWVAGGTEVQINHDLQWNRPEETWSADGVIWVARGFVLRRTPSMPSWIPTTLEASRRIFQPWHHTGADVKGLLGSPDLQDGWGQAVEWHYGPLEDGNDLVFDFDFGLLREIVTRESQIERWNTGTERNGP